MANILYGVNGEGSGHSTRAKVVIAHLQNRGHKVHVLSFDRGLSNLRADFEVTEIFGLRFAYVNNRVRYRRTVAKNVIAAPKAARSLKKLLRLADEWQIELVITDFEPLSCQVGRRKRLPVVCIDNQHCLTNFRVASPPRYRRDAAAAKLVSRFMVPHADAFLTTSFFPAEPRKRNSFLFPPIVREEVLSTTAVSGEHVLVYVTSPSTDLAAMLRQVRCPFIAYGFGREGQDGNVLYKAPSMDEFLRDLAGCKAIVANAGFSLVSEALHLGKPYLAVPVKGQFEQIFNAYHLDRLGYGAWWKELEKEKIESFLYNLPLFTENVGRYPRQDNSALLAKLDQLIADSASVGPRPARRRFARRRKGKAAGGQA